MIASRTTIKLPYQIEEQKRKLVFLKRAEKRSAQYFFSAMTAINSINTMHVLTLSSNYESVPKMPAMKIFHRALHLPKWSTLFRILWIIKDDLIFN